MIKNIIAMDIRGKILLVDDSATNNMLFSNVLEEQGYEVLNALNAIDGLEVIGKNRPDLVLLDLIMPGLSGLDFMKSIYRKYQDINIIVITSVNNDDTRETALQLGAKDYLLKPVEMDELVFKVNRIMAKRKNAV